MSAASDPNLLIGQFAAGGLLLAAFWRLIVWVRDAPVTPDPWDAAVAEKLAEPETPEACPHCSTPQSPSAWFCPHCGRAVGPYNNLMPYVQVFSEGEVFRNGVTAQFRNRTLVITGFLLITLSINPVFALIYLFVLLPHLRHAPDQAKPEEQLTAR
jgi:hypothetical protein